MMIWIGLTSELCGNRVGLCSVLCFPLPAMVVSVTSDRYYELIAEDWWKG